MAFDRSNAAHLQQLKTEINSDPNGQNYSLVLSETAALLSLLNDPNKNVGAPTINRPTEELDIPDIAGVISSPEYGLLSEYDKEWVKMFINRPADVMLKPYKSKFLNLFPNGSATRTAVLGLRVKPASRAEILWGVNTIISRDDWFAARDS